MIDHMPTKEVLAVVRLNQWSYDRSRLKAGVVTDYQRHGWRERRSTEADSRIVRVIDFERALSMLPPIEQAILLLVYRDRSTYHDTARALRCCERKTAYLLPTARKHLADTLDRLDLL
jgi:DNA-directed RNA polymerase specialized sigma24 family protein